MDKKYRSLIKDTLIFAIGSIGSKFILFILVPLYTNCLSPSEYGIADLVFTFSQFLIPILSLVIYHSVLRFGLSKYENPENVLLCGLIIATIGSVLTVCITPLLGFYKNISQWKWYFCFYIILSMFLSVLQNYSKAIGKNKAYSIVSILYTLVLALLNILFLAYAEMGVDGYLLSNVLATLVAVLIFIFVCNVFSLNKKAKVDNKLLKRMLQYSIPLVIDSSLWWLIQSSNKVLVESFLGAQLLGFFTTATKIPALMYIVVTIFSQAWGISTVKETEDVNDDNFYTRVFSVYSFICAMVCILIVSVIKPFMYIYVGKEFFQSWKYIPMLLAGNAFLAIADFFSAFYNAHKKTFRNMIVSLVAAIISVGISLVFMSKIGIWAAVFSSFFAYLIIMIIRIFDVKRFVKIKIKWFIFILNFLIVLIEAILITLGLNNILIALITIILFVIINFKNIKAFICMLKKNKI